MTIIRIKGIKREIRKGMINRTGSSKKVKDIITIIAAPKNKTTEMNNSTRNTLLNRTAITKLTKPKNTAKTKEINNITRTIIKMMIITNQNINPKENSRIRINMSQKSQTSKINIISQRTGKSRKTKRKKERNSMLNLKSLFHLILNIILMTMITKSKVFNE